MVSEITRFYCKPGMASWWFLRQDVLQAIIYEGFWKSDYDFRIAFHSNFLSGMHGFRDKEVLLPTGYDVIVIFPSCPGHCMTVHSLARIANCHDKIWWTMSDYFPVYWFWATVYAHRQETIDTTVPSPHGVREPSAQRMFIITFTLHGMLRSIHNIL